MCRCSGCVRAVSLFHIPVPLLLCVSHVVSTCVRACLPRPLQIVLCTDGLANVGLGSVEAGAGDAGDVTSPAAFYRRVGEFAASKGVVIDVMG